MRTSTVIEFFLSEPAKVGLSLYNIAGQQVKVLVDGNLDYGQHRMRLNISGLPSGIYFCRLTARHTHQREGGQAGDFTQTKKIVLMK